MSKFRLLLSCEHGGNKIPTEYTNLFRQSTELLDTHRAYDKGALELYRELEHLNPDFAISSTTSRLLVDLNRSLHKRSLFSEFTKPLSKAEKQQILDRDYFPYRNAFADEVKKIVDANESVLHLSVHSFTPILTGVERNADIGILYYPARERENAFSKKLKLELQKQLPQFKIRFNYPYRGWPDGHVSAYRRIYTDQQYAGIELEINNKWAFNNEIYAAVLISIQNCLVGI